MFGAQGPPLVGITTKVNNYAQLSARKNVTRPLFGQQQIAHWTSCCTCCINGQHQQPPQQQRVKAPAICCCCIHAAFLPLVALLHCCTVAQLHSNNFLLSQPSSIGIYSKHRSIAAGWKVKKKIKLRWLQSLQTISIEAPRTQIPIDWPPGPRDNRRTQLSPVKSSELQLQLQLWQIKNFRWKFHILDIQVRKIMIYHIGYK